jgi:hypothetical protein
MAKSKAELHKEGVAAGKVAADSDPDDFTADELQALLSGEYTVTHPVYRDEIVMPDGHIVLSKEDIDART